MCDIAFEKTKGRVGTVNRTSVYAEAVVRRFLKIGDKFCRISFFNKVKLCKSAALLKTRLLCRCVLANFAKFVRTHFFAEHHRATASNYSSINSSEGRINKRNLNYDTQTKT